MALSRKEIQQMLREMNVKFDAHEKVDVLRQRLQEENHRRWLDSVSGDRSRGGAGGKNLVRKRKKEPSSPDPAPEPPAPSTLRDEFGGSAGKKPSARDSEFATSRRPHTVEKPEPGKPWKAAEEGTEPFNRKKKVFDSVLRRAGSRCECCGRQSDEGDASAGLEPYHIHPLSSGGEHSIKNVVALCPACRDAVEHEPDPKTIKALKRRTRSKLYGSLEVVRKKNGPAARRSPTRRK